MDLITVAKLRAMLAEMPDNAVVVLASDAEGNEFSPMHGASRAETIPTYVRLLNDRRGKDQRAKPCLILWPQ